MTHIPEKLYFKIGEVAQIADVEPYVLRYWETEFKEICPVKSRSNQRLYRRKDIETVLHIKELLYGQGYTIDGAKKKIKELTKDHPETPKEAVKHRKEIQESPELEDQMMMFSFSEDVPMSEAVMPREEARKYDVVLDRILHELKELKASL